jgi:hypothetical protein
MYGVTRSRAAPVDYYRKFGLDVRGCRFPGIIPRRPGGGRRCAVAVFTRRPVRPATCREEDTSLPMMYMPNASIDIIWMDADPARLAHSNFNVTG